MSDNFAQHHHQDGDLDTMAPFKNGKPPGFRKISLENISLQALINTLVQQGFCSEEDLIAEEEKLQTSFQTRTEPSFNPVYTKRNGEHHQSTRQSSLRRWASKRRWARHLGTVLFGWKWKKIKKIS